MSTDQVTAHTAIKAVLQRQMDAWKAGDADAFGADVREDVAFTNALGAFTVGKPAFDRQHAFIFSGFFKDSRLELTVEHIALLRPDVAVVQALTEVEGGGPFPPGFPRYGDRVRTRLEQVLVQDDGRWRVAAYHNVTIAPVPRP